MAVGDITYDSNSPYHVGNRKVITGTIEVSNVYTAFALADDKTRIYDCVLMDADGAGSVEVDLNVIADGTATDGSISVAGNHVDVQTYRYTAQISG